MWETCNFNKYFRKPVKFFIKIIQKFKVKYRQTIKKLDGFELVDQNRAKTYIFRLKILFYIRNVKFSLKTIKHGWGRLGTVEDG
jgi:hypothetical protein